jgi:hypothetical protein
VDGKWYSTIPKPSGNINIDSHNLHYGCAVRVGVQIIRDIPERED